MAKPELTQEEIERMRDIVADHDAGSGKIQEFDLNNPPKVPYVHQPYPCIVYHHGQRIHKVAQNAAQHERALKEGWKDTPYPPEPPPEVELDTASLQEANEVQAQIEKLRRDNEELKAKRGKG